MRFEEKLTGLRKTNGYTQENLAEKLGVSRQAVARWEAGETTPDITMLRGICEIFHVSADYMLHDDYESDEDIPIAKAKNDKIEAVSEKNRQMHLVSAICFLIAATCFLFAAFCFTFDAGINGRVYIVIFQMFCAALNYFAAILQFCRYFSFKRK